MIIFCDKITELPRLLWYDADVKKNSHQKNGGMISKIMIY